MPQNPREKGPAARFIAKMNELIKRPVSDRLVEKINDAVQEDERQEKAKERDKVVAKGRSKEVDL